MFNMYSIQPRRWVLLYRDVTHMNYIILTMIDKSGSKVDITVLHSYYNIDIQHVLYTYKKLKFQA